MSLRTTSVATAGGLREGSGQPTLLASQAFGQSVRSTVNRDSEMAAAATSGAVVQSLRDQPSEQKEKCSAGMSRDMNM